MKIPRGMTKIDDRKIMVQGNSHVVSVPTNILKNAGVGKGDPIALYQKGNRFVLIDLKPEDE